MTENAKELINLLYTDNLTQFGKRQLADMIEKQQTKIKLLEQKDKRIDELEIALIDEQLKHTDKINKRTTKNSIEYLELQCIVNSRIHDYVSKYHNYPKYIKLPLWIFDCLKQTMCEVDLKIDYKTEEFTFFNLKVCETTSIEKPEEIEVF